jgi:hypothetical protein
MILSFVCRPMYVFIYLFIGQKIHLANSKEDIWGRFCNLFNDFFSKLECIASNEGVKSEL